MNMGSHEKSEWNLLFPVLAMVLFPFIRSAIGYNAIDSAFLIAAIPLIVFPAILIVGQIYKGTEMWKDQLKEGGIVALATLAITLSLTVWLLVEFLYHHAHFGAQGGIFSWISFDILRHDSVSWELAGTGDLSFTIGFGIWLDPVSLMVLFVAAFLCFLICWFAIGYMTTDPINEDRNHRFFGEFILFSCGMFGMVLADNFLWLFIFWEIMGLCSYLLIGFYWEKPSAAAAAKKAFLTTRVGDVFLMVGLFMMYDIYHSLDFAVILGSPGFAANGTVVTGDQLQWPLFFMFIGCVGKSAQFPLHVWLPDAMEGPTPVSALIHAATMVNAGLYLVARMFPIFSEHTFEGDLSELALLIAWIGGITACMAAFIAFVANDIKRVLAYSTMSQLAYIFTGLGAAMWFANEGHHHLATVAFGAALFHLFNHAMAKGMLFMASGSVIHEMHHAHDHVHGDDGDHHDFDPQDMRNMGGLASKLPVTSTAMMLGSMSIIGVPLIGGFWSKEGIVGQAWNVYLHGGEMILFPALLVLATAGMTGFYMSRMWFMTFAGKPKSEAASHVEEHTPWIKTPLITLSIVTAFSGFLLALYSFQHFLGESDGHLGLHDHDLLHSLLYTLEHAFLPKDGTLMVVGWTAILISSVLGPFIAARLHGGRLSKGEEAIPLVGWLVDLSGQVGHTEIGELAEGGFAKALHNRLYIDDVYEWLIAKTIIPLAVIAAWFDKRGVDGVIKGIECGSQSASTWIRSLTTGRASDYILMTVIGMMAVLGILWGVA
jgi:NADH-quinone oxidoreductase subunit L